MSLTPKQRQAATLVGLGAPLVEVAATVGVDVQTLLRWRTNGTAAEFATCAAQVADQVCEGLQGAAAKTTGELLASPDPMIQIEAVKLVNSRIAAIERRRLAWAKLAAEQAEREAEQATDRTDGGGTTIVPADSPNWRDHVMPEAQ